MEVYLHPLRDYADGKHLQVDDYAFGGGAGMVMQAEPIAQCIEHLQSQRTYNEIIYTSPDGLRLDQALCNRLSLQGNILVLCGHYKGVDRPLREKVRRHGNQHGRLRTLGWRTGRCSAG